MSNQSDQSGPKFDRKRPVFKRDLLIVADDGKMYHLTEAEYKANPVEPEAYCEARTAIRMGLTLGALIPVDENDGGKDGDDNTRACCGVCYVVNLAAIRPFNEAEGFSTFEVDSLNAIERAQEAAGYDEDVE